MTSPTATWLIERLKRDDLTAETRKRFKNRLKMQGCNKHPQPFVVNKRKPHYSLDAWRKISRRRKLANAAKRRNRRG